MRGGCALLAAVLLPGAVSAETLPAPIGGDGRIQAVRYNPLEVVLLRVPLGYQTTLELAPDERIENIGLGDGSAWQVTPNRRGDHVFIKPTSPGSRTDLVIVSDARTYALVLESVDSPSESYPFVVRYTYASATRISETAVFGPGDYRISGDRALRPTRVSDDGLRTTVEWPRQQPLPAIFAIGWDGIESLVNGRMENGSIVLEVIAPRIVFRRDRLMAEAERSPAQSADARP